MYPGVNMGAIIFPVLVFALISQTTTESNTCNTDQFKCINSTRCIPLRWQCDKERDCSDGSDEDPLICQERTCGTNQFSCADGQCLSLEFVCDDVEDCSDSSDELDCHVLECLPNEVTCGTGNETLCIHKTLLCDGVPDCPDESDEEFCTHCLPVEFICSDGTCINESRVCDGILDCPDGRDEIRCVVACRPGQFLCRSTKACLDGDLQCNGYTDCTDGSDEDECKPVFGFDPKSMFRCNGGFYLGLDMFCDGIRNCPEGEDEPSGKCGVNECLVNKGNCSHLCVDTLTSFHCDCRPGYKLMDDGQTCGVVTEPGFKCDPKTQFDCDGSTCIRLDLVCNGIADCPKGEDEPNGKCGVNECLVNKGNCSHLCVDTLTGFHCDCRPGYKLMDDGQTCGVEDGLPYAILAIIVVAVIILILISWMILAMHRRHSYVISPEPDNLRENNYKNEQILLQKTSAV